MSAPPPAIILHVGAPKCGARLLQQALSAAPLLESDIGPLAYTALHPKGRGWALLSGKALQTAARRAVSGRLGWPDADQAESGLFDALDRLRCKPPGGVPIVSNPGWIGQADVFAKALPQWFAPGGPEVQICGFVRPPLDWLNAAYWEWGVWSGRGFGAWLAQMGMPYTLGAALSRWRSRTRSWQRRRWRVRSRARPRCPRRRQWWWRRQLSQCCTTRSRRLWRRRSRR